MKSAWIIVMVVLVVCLLMEALFPLRIRRDRTSLRWLHNFSMAIVALPFTRLLALPLVYFFISLSTQYQWGLLNLVSGPAWALNLAGFILLDYCLYWWHVGLHRLKFLWRFHQVHHSDKDMDATTALRFHFGELLLSAALRCALAVVLGFSLETLIVFDLAVTSVSLFHHSNLKLPPTLERILGLLIVTPLFHQSHHSFVLAETDSNFSAIFNFWDKLHRSFSGLFKPSQITIGIPALEVETLTFYKLIKMPVQKVTDWPSQFKERSRILK